jgi:hypothetical protein
MLVDCLVDCWRDGTKHDISAVPFSGKRQPLLREKAIERYIVLRLRAEDINRLDFLVRGFHDKTIKIPGDSPFTHADFKDTARTAFFGWFATLTDRDGKAVYAFDPLYTLFQHKRTQIHKVQVECEACHAALQQFRNNVAFHSRAEIAHHIRARQNLQQMDTHIDLEFARKDFQRLMADLILEELTTIPELPKVLSKLGISHHPAFANVPSLPTVGP